MLFSWYVASFESYNRLYGSLGAGMSVVRDFGTGGGLI